eukprot:CAMPEP_0197542710 /NCGR_PEP_ID=MMETSP1318-20131121/67851_1 /TAXON_ID=552666 /ORGANISM="Partenskyella glossopodia, Strain RCC365" /LENGTH=146 /DNA_ID=CAMNT_0043101995 /DNA_START=845 /DNA_END=1285 /DNA_ORIENTATION=+
MGEADSVRPASFFNFLIPMPLEAHCLSHVAHCRSPVFRSVSMLSESGMRGLTEIPQPLAQVHLGEPIGNPSPEPKPLKIGQNHKPMLSVALLPSSSWKRQARHEPDLAFFPERDEAARTAVETIVEIVVFLEFIPEVPAAVLESHV